NSTNLSVQQSMTANEAARSVRRVCSCYPSANPLELKGYLAELALVLAKFSAAIGNAALDAAMRDSPNFPPPVPLVERHCGRLTETMAERRRWNAELREQFVERAAREAQDAAEPLELRRANAQRILADWHAARALHPATSSGSRQWQRLSDAELRQMYPPKKED